MAAGLFGLDWAMSTWFLAVGAVLLGVALLNLVPKKKDQLMGIGGTILVIGLFLYANPGMGGAPATAGVPYTPSNSANVATSATPSPGFATVTANFRNLAKNNDTATAYHGGTYTINNDKRDFQVLNGGGSASGLAVTLGVDSTYNGIVVNSTATGFYGKKLEFSIGRTPSTVDWNVFQFASPRMQLINRNVPQTNVSGWYNAVANANLSDYSALALSAGGAPANLELDMDVSRTNPKRVFGNGDLPILVCDDLSPSVWQIIYSSPVTGSVLPRVTAIPQVSLGNGDRQCFELDRKQFSADMGQTPVTWINAQILSGAAKTNGTISLYDSDYFVSIIDGRTIMSGVGDNGPTSTSVGVPTDPRIRLVS